MAEQVSFGSTESTPTLGWGSFRSIQRRRGSALNDQGRPREIWPREDLDFVKRAGLKRLDSAAQWKVVKSPESVRIFHSAVY